MLENEPLYITKLDKNRNVVKSNKLVEARYRLTNTEQKLVYAVISAISINDREFNTVIFKVKELAEYCNISTTNRYKEIRDATETLLTRVIKINDEEGLLQTHWVQNARYSPGGIVRFKIDEALKPYLLQLKDSFSSFKSAELMSFKSSYTSRVYELALQYKKIGVRKISVEEFKDRLLLTGKSYSLFSNVKNRVIEPALDEINSNTIHDITCEYQNNAGGRRITDLVFRIRLKSTQAIDAMEKNKEIKTIDVYPDDNIAPPQSEDVLQYVLAKVNLEDCYDYYVNSGFSPERIISNIEYTIARREEITHLANYAREAIASDYAQVDVGSLFMSSKEREEEIVRVKEKLNKLQQQRDLYYRICENGELAEESFRKWYRLIYKEEYTDNTEKELLEKLP